VGFFVFVLLAVAERDSTRLPGAINSGMRCSVNVLVLLGERDTLPVRRVVRRRVHRRRGFCSAVASTVGRAIFVGQWA